MIIFYIVYPLFNIALLKLLDSIKFRLEKLFEIIDYFLFRETFDCYESFIKMKNSVTFKKFITFGFKVFDLKKMVLDRS